jgi:nicotinate-nucleotide adenylyltransferase
MVELAISFNPHFALSDIELRRKGPSYSIITVKQLRKLYPKKKLFFLVGSDFLREFPFWKKIRQLRKLCSFVVARRPGYKIKHLPKDMCTLQVNALDISSTDIRRRLRGKESIRYLVPEQVRSYILRKKLYAS